MGQLNRVCLEGEDRHIIRIAEGLHEKKIAQIADEILSRQPQVRLVTIAGPSSSGKTTFAKRLRVQLKVNGIEMVSLSLDNYYVDRDQTPRDEDGKLDFESLEAIDLPLFHQHLAELMAGESVLTPRFDFVTGSRRPENEWAPMQLEDNHVLVVEGIHGLNDRLTQSVPQKQRYRIFISALSAAGHRRSQPDLHIRCAADSPHRARPTLQGFYRRTDPGSVGPGAKGRGKVDLSVPGTGGCHVQLGPGL